MLKKFLRENKFTLLCISLLIFITLMSFRNTFQAEFVFDDFYSIARNADIKKLIFSNIYKISRTRFVTNLSFALNYHFSGLDSSAYHVLNFFIHLTNIIIVYFIVQLLIRLFDLFKKDNFIIKIFPLSVALVFAVHPIQTQAVSYIVQRYTILASLFYLLSLYFYVKSILIRKNSPGKISPLQFWLCFVSSLICAVLAFFSKEISYSLPFTLLMIESVNLQNTKLKIRKRLIYVFPFFLLAFLTFAWQRSGTISEPIRVISNTISEPPSALRNIKISRQNYIFTQINVTTTYLRLLLLPVNQNAYYDFSVVKNLFQNTTIFNLIFLILLVFFALFHKDKHKIITFGILFFFITLSVEGITPIDDAINEHRLYLASLGFILTVQFVLYQLLLKLKSYKKEAVWMMFIALWVIILSFLTYRRNFVWQSQSTLWTDTVKKSPNKPLAHYNLGVVFHYQGDTQSALTQFQKAVNLNENYADAYENLGSEFMNLGDVESAKVAYLKNLDLNPNNSSVKLKLLDVYAQERNWPKIEESYQNSIIKYGVLLPLQKDSKGIMYLKQNKLIEARLEFENALKDDPNFIDARYNLAATLYRLNETIRSIEQYQQILKQDKNQPQVLTDLGVIYLEQGNLIGAKNMLKSSFDLDPNNGITLYFLGLTDYKQGFIKEALNYLTQAYVVSPDSFQSLELIGDIYYSQGKLKKSLIYLKRAELLKKNSETISEKIYRIEKLGM
mgnify:CR=1 FL=1